MNGPDGCQWMVGGLVGCLRHTPDARGQAELLINSFHFVALHCVSGAFTDITSHIHVVTPSMTSGGDVTSGLQAVAGTVTSYLKSLYISTVDMFSPDCICLSPCCEWMNEFGSE